MPFLLYFCQLIKPQSSLKKKKKKPQSMEFFFFFFLRIALSIIIVHLWGNPN